MPGQFNGGVGYVSEFRNWGAAPSVTTYAMIDGASISNAGSCMVPLPVSASFMRFYVSFATVSASAGSATTTALGSNYLRNTWNAVFYKMGTGANSASLESVASGSVSYEWLNSLSANSAGSQYTLTHRAIVPIAGGYTTLSATLATTSASYNMPGVSDVFSIVSGARMFDMPFANSLSAGPYWVIIGCSSQSSIDNGLSDIGTANFTLNRLSLSVIGYVAHYGVNSSFGLMGSSNRTIAYQGVGSFSTAGGGTTASLPYSAISSFSVLAAVQFQLLRSA